MFFKTKVAPGISVEKELLRGRFVSKNMATSDKGIEILKEDQINFKLRRSNLAHSEKCAVASEDDLEGILRDVEKIEANARCCKNLNKPKWKPKIEFTHADEKDLNRIFEDAEKRKKNIEELLDANKRGDSDDSDDDDDTSSNSSSSSDESSDSDLDRLLEDTETELAEHEKKEKEMDDKMDEILEDVRRTESKADFKR